MSSRVDDVTCEQLVEILTDYLEGVLDARRRADIEHHIVLCRGCANYVDQMRCTIDLLARIADEDGADAKSDELLAIFRGWRDERCSHAPEGGGP